MIDVHSHILWGVDDSAIRKEESCAMALFLSNLGFKTILASPHIISGKYENNKDIIELKTKELNDDLVLKNIGLKVIPFAEVYIDENLINRLEQKQIPLWQNQLLLEGPFHSWPDYIWQILSEVKQLGFGIIIAHPERNNQLAIDFKAIEKLKTNDFKLQCNLLSSIGFYGPFAKSCLEQLLKNDMVDFLATDLHVNFMDSNLYQEAFLTIINLIGQAKFNKLLGV